MSLPVGTVHFNSAVFGRWQIFAHEHTTLIHRLQLAFAQC